MKHLHFDVETADFYGCLLYTSDAADRTAR